MLLVFGEIFYGIFLPWLRGSVLSAAHSSKTENCLNMFIGVTSRDCWTRIPEKLLSPTYMTLKCCCGHSHLNLGFSPLERANPVASKVRQIALFVQTLWSTWSFCSFLSCSPSAASWILLKTHCKCKLICLDSFQITTFW